MARERGWGEDRLRVRGPVSQGDAPTEGHHHRLRVIVDEDRGGRRGELPVHLVRVRVRARARARARA